jgi:aspartyl-tRNA(Asn)/glutamyl-tRNA(Gln) amidotransferase subunit C
VSLTSTSSRVTAEEVRHIADLSNLRLTPEEEISMERDLNAILSYVAELNELDTSTVVPMAQVSEMLASEPQAEQQDSRAALRPDEPRPSLERERVMVSAPDTDGAFFKVPKVIER